MLNWKSLDVTYGRQLKTILYVTNANDKEELATFARGLGWTVFKAPRLSSSGVPYLKEMYNHASQHLTNCTFYGFSNGDILYSRDLVVTLYGISQVVNLHVTGPDHLNSQHRDVQL